MATHEIEAQWMGKMQFNALIDEHTIVMDAPKRSGGEENGPIPKPFILAALSGCTGMDIVVLLKKSNIIPTDLNIIVSGVLSKHIPIQYVAMHINYVVKANFEDKNAVMKAVTESQERYCGVSAMLKKALPITWEINFNGLQVFNNRFIEMAILHHL